MNEFLKQCLQFLDRYLFRTNRTEAEEELVHFIPPLEDDISATLQQTTNTYSATNGPTVGTASIPCWWDSSNGGVGIFTKSDCTEATGTSVSVGWNIPVCYFENKFSTNIGYNSQGRNWTNKTSYSGVVLYSGQFTGRYINNLGYKKNGYYAICFTKGADSEEKTLEIVKCGTRGFAIKDASFYYDASTMTYYVLRYIRDQFQPNE